MEKIFLKIGIDVDEDNCYSFIDLMNESFMVNELGFNNEKIEKVGDWISELMHIMTSE